jgi:hypothetical protein
MMFPFLGGEQEPSCTNREPPRFRGNSLGKSITPKGYYWPFGVIGREGAAVPLRATTSMQTR